MNNIKNANNVYFKFLIYPYIIFVVSQILIIWLYVENKWYISSNEFLLINITASIFVLVFCVFLFVKDVVFLKDRGYYCPSYWCFFILPLYIYLRQKTMG